MHEAFSSTLSPFGIQHLFRELGWLLRRGLWHTIPYALLYELFRAAGFWLGLQGARDLWHAERRLAREVKTIPSHRKTERAA